MVNTVQRKTGETGELLIALLETRLDNLVYRLKFAQTRYQARQYVGHGHIRVNGKKVTIPSYQVKEGDTITLSEKMKLNPVIAELLKEETVALPFLERTQEAGKLVRMPKREDVQVPFDTQLIIEYYSR